MGSAVPVNFLWIDLTIVIGAPYQVLLKATGVAGYNPRK
jgi:hypothetical protein